MKPAQYLPDPGQPGIIFRCPDLSRQTFGVLDHGTKLEDIEMLTASANPFLRIENRAPVFQPDGNGHYGPNNQPYRKKQYISDNYYRQIEDALVSVTYISAFFHAFLTRYQVRGLSTIIV